MDTGAMPIACDEISGPVGTVVPFDTKEKVITVSLPQAADKSTIGRKQ